MRLYYWKQWGRPRTRRRKLLKLGIGRDEVHKASRSRKGHWRMSHNSLAKRAMNNKWLAGRYQNGICRSRLGGTNINHAGKINVRVVIAQKDAPLKKETDIDEVADFKAEQR